MPLRISREADALRWARGRAVIAALGGASFLASPAAYAVDSDLDGVPEYGFLTRSAVSVSLDQVDRIYVLDMDDDNDLDLLVANETTISWVENSDGAGHFGSEHAITGPGENQRLADLVDLDGDGDLDILTNAIGIYPNNGLGNFGAFQAIVTPPYSDGRALGSDLDGDGDGDVVWRGATRFSNLIAPGTGWYNNTDGAGTMGPLQLFARGWPDPGPSHVIGDLDSDGDPDIASFDPFGSDWYANTDGLGTFGPAQTIPESTADLSQGGPISMEGETADIDGDGDTDLLFTWRGSQLSPYPYLWYDQVTWYENDGSGDFTRHFIELNQYDELDLYPDLHATGALVSQGRDLDNDGDTDVVLVRTGGVQWYANLDGQGTFSSLRFIESDDTEPYLSVGTGDLDGDGRIDLVVGSSRDEPLHWYPQVAPDDPSVAPDNCPDLPNANQLDDDGNGVGNLCQSGFVTVPTLAWPGALVLGLLILATGAAIARSVLVRHGGAVAWIDSDR